MKLSRGFKVSLAVILCAAAAPFLLWLGVGLFALISGCVVDESGPHACVVFGLDLGYPLYAIGMISVLTLIIGVPIAAVGLLIWSIVFGIAASRRRRQLNG